MPADLPPDAAAVWTAVVVTLAAVPGLLTLADGETLELYARTKARWLALERFTEEHGPVLVVRDERGELKWTQPTPQASLAAKLLPQLRALGDALGLSPAARTRIDVDAPPADDELTRFLRARA